MLSGAIIIIIIITLIEQPRILHESEQMWNSEYKDCPPHMDEYFIQNKHELWKMDARSSCH